LRSLDELPNAEELRARYLPTAQPKPEIAPAIELVEQTQNAEVVPVPQD